MWNLYISNKIFVTLQKLCFWNNTSSILGDFYVANLDSNCLKCLCHAATDCDLARGYVQGYAGPFKISNLYWIDAGNITLPNDDPERGKGKCILLQLIYCKSKSNFYWKNESQIVV